LSVTENLRSMMSILSW